MTDIELNRQFATIRRLLYEAGYTKDFNLHYTSSGVLGIAGRLKSVKGFICEYDTKHGIINYVTAYTSKKLPITEQELLLLCHEGCKAMGPFMDKGIVTITPGRHAIKKSVIKDGRLIIKSAEEKIEKRKAEDRVIETDKQEMVEVQYPDLTANEKVMTTPKTFWKDIGKLMSKGDTGYFLFQKDGTRGLYRIIWDEKPRYKIRGIPDRFMQELKDEPERLLSNGQHQVAIQYPSQIYWAGYYKWINKGYHDITKSVTGEKIQLNKVTRNYPSEAYGELWSILVTGAKDYLTRTIPSNARITKDSLTEAWVYVERMKSSDDTDFIKESLEYLQTLIPRIKKDSNKDINKAIAKEERLLQAIEAKMMDEKVIDKEIFDPMEIEVGYPQIQEEQMIKQMFKNRRVLRYTEEHAYIMKIYKVRKASQEARQQEYKQETGHTKCDLLWHGSKTESWGSILKNNLTSSPEDIEGADWRFSGSALGKGLYFADNPYKSISYSSLGKDSIGVMGIYSVVNEKPLKKKGGFGNWNWQRVNREGYDLLLSVGGSLNNRDRDEYVVFDERECTPRYIVIFGIR